LSALDALPFEKVSDVSVVRWQLIMKHVTVRAAIQSFFRPWTSRDSWSFVQQEMLDVDKTTGDMCPRCGSASLNVYYEEDADVQLGARCDECGLKGFFMNGKLVQLATA